MGEPRFFTEQSLDEGLTLELETAPSQHIARSLRMGNGDTLTLFNGNGGEYPATIIAVDKRKVTVKLQSRIHREVESPLQIQLGIAISRGDRMDWVIQKTTELGVTRIAPLTSERGGHKLTAERAQKKLEHWRKVAASACEQCGRNQLPLIDPIQPLTDWTTNCDANTRLVLHHRQQTVAQLPTHEASAALLIGPEGGLSADEIHHATSSGFIELTLGPRVLRTETAPLAAIAILQSRWGDMPIS